MFDRPQCFVAALLVALASVMPQSAPAQSSQIGSFVGTYSAMRPGADSAQSLKLELAPHGVARLTTEFPRNAKTAGGAPLYPNVEEGNWAVGGPYAIVHLTRSLQYTNDKARALSVPLSINEDVALSFWLSRCTLKLTRDPSNHFGVNGLKLKKRDC